jgi:starch synthase
VAAYSHPIVASPDEEDVRKVVGGRVLFVVSEFEDYVRVGGLASVAAALSRALRSFCDIRICIPGYRAVLSKASSMEVVGRCPPSAGLPECDVGLLYTKDGMPVYVLLCHELYNREGSAYSDEQGTDWKDNDIRFARFASAAAAIAAGEVDCGWEADLVHVNDWPAALVPAYLHWNARPLPSTPNLN